MGQGQLRYFQLRAPVSSCGISSCELWRRYNSCGIPGCYHGCYHGWGWNLRRMSRSSVSIPLVATVLLGSGVLVGLNRIASKGITVTQSVYVTLGIGFGITIGVLLVLRAFRAVSIDWIEPAKSLYHGLAFLQFRVEAPKLGCLPPLTHRCSCTWPRFLHPDLVALLPVTLGVSHLLGRHVERYRVFNSIAMLMLVLYLSFASTA